VPHDPRGLTASIVGTLTLESTKNRVLNKSPCRRFTLPAATQGAPELWIMTPDQAERLAATAADTKIAIQGLLFRLRWSKVYEEGIVNGESAADITMMTINQERFEDPPTH
jgi:hypothetical protein